MFRFKLVVFGPVFEIGHFSGQFLEFFVVFGPIFKTGVDFVFYMFQSRIWLFSGQFLEFKSY